MRPIAIDVAWSVCLLDTSVSTAKTAEPIKMPFGSWTWVGLRNHELGGSPDSPGETAISGGHVPSHCKV